MGSNTYADDGCWGGVPGALILDLDSDLAEISEMQAHENKQLWWPPSPCSEIARDVGHYRDQGVE